MAVKGSCDACGKPTADRRRRLCVSCEARVATGEWTSVFLGGGGRIHGSRDLRTTACGRQLNGGGVLFRWTRHDFHACLRCVRALGGDE